MRTYGPRRYWCKAHDRGSELMTFEGNGQSRPCSVFPDCLEAIRLKYRAAIACQGPHGLFDGLPAKVTP